MESGRDRSARQVSPRSGNRLLLGRRQKLSPTLSANEGIASDVDLLRNLDGIIDLDAEAARLDSPQVARPPVGNCIHLS